MSQHLHELCCLVVEEFYGEFYGSIYSHILQAGRCNAGQLAQRCRLPLRQIKCGLASLVQLRLVYHHTTNGITMYQADAISAYDILRRGKLVELARYRYGDLAADVVIEASLLGFSTIAELCQHVALRMPVNENGEANEEHSFENINRMVQTLRTDKYLLNVRSVQFQTKYDAFQDVLSESKALGISPSTKGKKGQLEFEEKIEAERCKRQSVQLIEHGHATRSEHKHHTEDGAEPPAKRRKQTASKSSNQINGHLLNGSDHAQDTIMIAISYHNLIRHTRDSDLVSLCKKTLGQRYSRVLHTALQQLPTTDKWTTTNSEAWLDTEKMRRKLSEALVVNGNAASHANGNTSPNLDDKDSRFRCSEIDQILKSCSESFFHFIQLDTSQGVWSIDKQDLDTFLQEREILRLIEDRLGSPALRVIRMLNARGKLDEKVLQETGLLGAKELRQTLADLKQMGFIDLQEVPREAQRQPNRTIFLWFHDTERVRKLLLEKLYKSMSRLMQRLKLERMKLASTLEKVERSDVQGSEDHILSPAELKVLKRLRRTEQWLLGELGRLDDSVAILRDL